MTLLTFSSTDLLNSYTIILFIPDVLVKTFVYAVKFISMSIVVIELNFSFPVAVDAPAHTKFSELGHLWHFLYRPMTGLALLLANFYVL